MSLSRKFFPRPSASNFNWLYLALDETLLSHSASSISLRTLTPISTFELKSPSELNVSLNWSKSSSNFLAPSYPMGFYEMSTLCKMEFSFRSSPKSHANALSSQFPCKLTSVTELFCIRASSKCATTADLSPLLEKSTFTKFLDNLIPFAIGKKCSKVMNVYFKLNAFSNVS